MPIVHINDARVNVMQLACKSGDVAEDLVMVHGLAANMAFWLQHYAPKFSERFRVTLYDLRGHGRSELTGKGYTPDDMAADLAGVIGAMGLRRPHVVAHSFGGVAVLNLACKRPDLFSSIVINDSHIGLGRARVKETDWKARDTIQSALNSCGIALDTRDPYFGYRLVTAVARIEASGREVPEALLPWVKWMLNAGNAKAAQRWLQLIDTTQAEQELMQDDGITEAALKSITSPMLSLYGERSQAMATGQYLRQTLPALDFVTVENGGHFFAKAQPELVIRECERFWNAGGKRHAAA